MTSAALRNTRRVNVVFAIVLCLLGMLCYGNSLTGPFIFDDNGNIVGNPALESFFPSGEEARLATRRPVGHFSLALNYALARKFTGDGLDERGFHIFNLAVHILAGLVLFDLVRRTLHLPGLQPRYGPLASQIAFAVAAIWLVHPLQTSSVTYIIQRLESLMGLFYLLCIYSVLRGDQSSRWWYVVAVVAFWLGIGTKEVMATAVVVVPLYDRIFLSDSWSTVIRRRWGMYLAFVPALVWFAVILAPTMSSDSKLTVGFGVRDVTPLEYLCSQPGVLLHYLRLTVWPYPLCLDYAWPVAQSAAAVLVPGLVIVTLLASSLLALMRWPRIGFLASAFFFILAPTSSIMPIQELAFEYRMYLPLAPLIVLLVVATYHGWNHVLTRLVPVDGTPKRHAKRARERRASLQRIVPTAIVVAIIAVFSLLTISRNRDYSSVKSIWLDTVHKSPNNDRAHINLGNVYLGEGDYQAALQSYSTAIQVKPDSATAYSNRGRVYSDLKQYKLALADYERAIEIDPEHAKAYHNRGIAYTQSGEYQKAIADLTKALSLEPKAETYFSRGNAYLLLGEFDAAIDDYTAELNLSPDSADALLNRGRAYRRQRRYDEAIRDFSATIDLRRNQADAYSNRAICYWYTQQYDRAWKDVRSAKRVGGQVPPQLIRQLEAATGRRE